MGKYHIDPEIKAMRTIVRVLKPLSEEQRRRVLCAICVLHGFDDLAYSMMGRKAG